MEINVSPSVRIIHGRVLGTKDCHYADVYVKMDKKYNLFSCPFSTIMWIEGEVWGMLNTLRPSGISHLPVGVERSKRVHDHYAKAKRVSDRILARHNMTPGI